MVQYFVPTKKPEDPRPPNPRRTAVFGLLIIVLLLILGLYLTHALRESSRVQDCVMQGRTNCAPIDAQPN